MRARKRFSSSRSDLLSTNDGGNKDDESLMASENMFEMAENFKDSVFRGKYLPRDVK